MQVRRIKLCRGQLFSNAVRIMLCIADIQYYVPIKLCKTVGSIHLLKIWGILTPEKVKLNKHYTWDILEADWKEVKVTFNGKAKWHERSVPYVTSSSAQSELVHRQTP